jgi:hypothetical protein
MATTCCSGELKGRARKLIRGFKGDGYAFAVKSANVLASLGEYEPEIEPYFGTGLVTAALQKTGKKLLPMVAVESAASSGYRTLPPHRGRHIQAPRLHRC